MFGTCVVCYVICLFLFLFFRLHLSGHMYLLFQRDKMCLPGGSRLCLVCLVVSVWRPVVGVNPGKESATEETTYPPLQHGHFQTTHDHNDLQIKQIHHLEIHKQGQFFYDRIMEKYGENGRLTLEGLKRIFYNIGLDSLKNNTTNVGLFSDHEHHDDHEHSAEHHDDHEHSAEHHDHDEIHKENILGISESPSPQKRKRRKISFEEISNDTVRLEGICIRKIKKKN